MSLIRSKVAGALFLALCALSQVAIFPAHATVSTETRKAGPYAGNGVATSFAFAFKVFAKSDLVITTATSAGVETIRVLDSDYSVSLNSNQDSNPGGTVTYPISGSPLVAGNTLTIDSGVPRTQGVDLLTGGPFLPNVIENALDRSVILSQQVQRDLDRTIKQPKSDSAAIGVLPVATSRASKFLSFDTNGNPSVAQAVAINAEELAAVETIALLKAVSTTGLTDRDEIFVQGYYAAGDGGGGHFYWDAGSSATDNGGTIIDPPAAGNGRWLRIYSGAVYAAWFGAITGQTAATVTIGLDAALVASRYVKLQPGSVNANTLTMSTAGTTLELLSNSEISFQSATSKGINVTAANCAVLGPGTLKSPATFDGTNADRTYAVVWVEGDGFRAQDFTMDTIPRAGIRFQDATNFIVSRVKFIGNFPYASYTGTNTGHVAIDYNTPALASKPNTSGIIQGNRIETSVQGILAANFGAVGSHRGLTVTGNSFNQLWDHGAYLQSMEASSIVGNTFHNVRKPIVVSKTAAQVVGNTLFSSDTGQTNYEQGISVRDADYSRIEGNTIYGVGAHILVDAFDTTQTKNISVKNNTLHSTATEVNLVNAIRIGFNAETTSDNVVEGNTISGVWAGTFDGVISLQTKNSSFVGQNNIVRNNTISTSSNKILLQVSDQNNATLEGNKVESTFSAGGATTVEMVVFNTSTNTDADRNTLTWRTGGTNVTARGFRVNAGCTDIRLTDNRFQLTSASLSATDPIVDTGTDTYTARNQRDIRVPMAGTFTWTTTTSSFAVTNANVVAGSRILLTPVDADAGVVIQTKGYYVTAGAGSFTIFTGDGTNTAAASDWFYVID